MIMKKRYILIAISLLVIINITALTVMSYNKYCQYKTSCLCSEANTFCSNYLAEPLSLTKTQILLMDSIRTDFILEMQKSTAALKTKRLAIIDLLNQSKPDPEKIEMICTEINIIQAGLQKAVIHNILKEKMVLNPQQKKIYLSIIKARILLDNSVSPKANGADNEECKYTEITNERR